MGSLWVASFGTESNQVNRWLGSVLLRDPNT